MNTFPILIGALCVYAIAYRYYSAFIAAKALALDDRRVTPAHQFRDGHNFIASPKWVLFGPHFAAIAAATPSTETEPMDPASPVADITSFYIQEIGAVLFGTVFLFLYRQSRVVYFGLWAVAWGMRVLATFFGYQLLRTQHSGWLAPYATFEFGFAIVLIAAARAGFGSSLKDWRTVLRLISILPIFVALVWAIGQYSGLEAYHASHAVVGFQARI